MELEFTGEFYIPGKMDYEDSQMHIQRYAFASKFVREKFVLDVACGTGYGTKMLREKGAIAIGLDKSKEAIKYAMRNYGREYILGNCTTLPFKDDVFDVVISMETIEHIKDYKKFLSECRRVLKDSGIFICSTPNKETSFPYRNDFNIFHLKEFYPEELFSIISKYFKKVEKYGQGYISIFRRMRRNITALLNLWALTYKIKLYCKNKIFGENIVKRKSFDNIDKKYSVITYYKSKFKFPTTLVCVAKKE
ncbi:MAG: class I SAM-dependent methyltransferase [Candidatus Thermoplasmatota archaeon]